VFLLLIFLSYRKLIENGRATLKHYACKNRHIRNRGMSCWEQSASLQQLTFPLHQQVHNVLFWTQKPHILKQNVDFLWEWKLCLREVRVQMLIFPSLTFDSDKRPYPKRCCLACMERGSASKRMWSPARFLNCFRLREWVSVNFTECAVMRGRCTGIWCANDGGIKAHQCVYQLLISLKFEVMQEVIRQKCVQE
jgi:hypothetical protein